MMFVVAIIAILAAIAIPMFTKESNKGKGQSEVMAWFAAIQAKQENYKVDNGSYLNIAGACPSTTNPTGIAMTCHTGAWAALNIEAPMTTVACSYQIVAGNATGTNNPSGFTFSSPARNWYYVLATCDEDSSGGTNATFFTSSIDSSIQKLNEGQ
jgi:type II secretory pathway pseudopilin PulG